MGKYRNIANVPAEVEQGDKRIQLEPGGFVDLSGDDEKSENNVALVERGYLIEAPAEKGK